MVNLPNWILVLGTLLLAWLAMWSKKIFFKKVSVARLAGKHVPDTFTIQIIEKIFTIAILFIAMMIVLQVFGLNILPLLTFSGIGAAFLGFASKDMVANFFGGLMIYITRPFSVNDEIEIPSKKIVGKVEEIGWYLTTIRDKEKKSIYVPNSTFSTEYLLNQSRMTHRRIDEQIRLRIGDLVCVEKLLVDVRSMIEKHPEIDHLEQIDVFLLSFSPYGVVIDVKAYTKSTKYLKFMAVKQEILINIYRLAGVGLA